MSTLMGSADKAVGQNPYRVQGHYNKLVEGNMGILNSIIGNRFGSSGAQFTRENLPYEFMKRQQDLAFGFDQPVGVKKGRQGLGGSILGLAGGIIGGIFGGAAGAQIGMAGGQMLGSATMKPQTRIRM